MRHQYLLIILLFVAGCNPAEKYMEQLGKLDSHEKFEAYQMRLGYSALVMSGSAAPELADEITGKLIDLQAFTEARYCIEYLLENDGPTAERYYRMAVCYRHQYQCKMAQEAIEHALRLDGSNLQFRKEQEMIAADLPVWEKIDSVSRLLAVSRTADLLNARAGLLISLRQFMPAIDDLNSTLEMDSINVESLYLKAMTYLYTHDFAVSDSVFDKLLKLDLTEDQRKLFSQYATAAGRLAKIEEQISKEPAEPLHYLEASRELSMISDYDRALEMLRRGLVRAADDPRLLQARILVYLQMGKKEKAHQDALYMESLGYKVDPQLRRMLE